MENAEHFQTFYIDISQENAATLVMSRLKERGLVTFDHIHTVEELRFFCAKLGKLLAHRDADEYGVTRIIQHEASPSKDGYRAFTNADLALHTDGSSISEPATLVVFWCAEPGETGGLSLFADGKQIYHLLSMHYPHVLQTLVKPRSVIFAGAETPLESAVFGGLPDGKMRIRFRYDSLGYYSAPVSSILPLFLGLLGQHTIEIALQRHQGYIVQNGRWLHGRTAFSGGREAYRILLQSSEPDMSGFDLD